MNVFGIDPGLKGGLALVNPTGLIFLCVMPTIRTGRGARSILDLPVLCRTLEEHKPDLVVVEEQQAFPKQGGVSNFSTGRGIGDIEGLLTALRISWRFVRPRDWQRPLGIGGKDKDKKRQALLVCRRLFPTVNLLATPKCTKPHDGLADALLIARHGLLSVKGMGIGQDKGSDR